MERPPVAITFNSLSACPTRPLEALRATKGTAQRTTELVRSAETVVGEGQAAISLHVGRNVRTAELVTLLRENNIPLSDIDVPEIKRLSVAALEAFGNIIIGNIGRAKNHIGWALTNVGSARMQTRKVIEGLEATKEDKRQVVRVQALDLDKRRGKKLVEKIAAHQQRTQNTVCLAIEINADKQTPEEYLTFVKDKQKEYKAKGLTVAMDIDLGHIARKSHDPLAFLRHVLADETLRPLVRFVTYNQYIKDEIEAHARIDAPGEVDFEQATRIIRENKSTPTILFESHPGDFEWMKARDGGIETIRRITA